MLVIEARRQRPKPAKSGAIRTRVPDSEVETVRDVRFSTAIRGYDRDQVDRYVSRVNNVIAELQITVDCDVLQADGGTRTAAICGGYVALHDAFSRMVAAGTIPAHPITDACAAISVGVVDALPHLDLDYSEDVRAEVDMNVVMTGAGRFVEVQGTAEGNPFSRSELDELLALAEKGITEIFELQRATLAEPPVPRPS